MSVLQEYLTNIANAIREKKETTAPIPAQNFASEILSIEGGSKVTDTPLTIAENGTTEAPDGIRYTPITVAVPRPTLNTPEIYASAGTGNLIVNDLVNGIFTSEYLLYVDGVERATYTEKAIPMQEYIVTGEEQLQVRCKNDTFFNESELSNAITWNFLINGTPGLTYEGNTWTDIGEEVTATTIYVASIINGTKIMVVNIWTREYSNFTIILPDTIVRIDGMQKVKDSTIVFGANLAEIGGYKFNNAPTVILDFSKATKIPTLNAYAFGNRISPKKVIVPDSMYEDWIVTTNWTMHASVTIRTSEWIAQGGAV